MTDTVYKLVKAQRELIKILTLELITPFFTTLTAEKNYKQMLKKEDKLRKRIARLEQKIIDEESVTMYDLKVADGEVNN